MRREYQPITLHRPLGEQLRLWQAHLPGQLSPVSAYDDLLLTEPNESHALETLEETLFLVLTRGPRGGDRYESDTFRLDVPLIPPPA